MELVLRRCRFVAIGALVPMGAFDLEFGDGIFHCGFYLVATLLLRWAAGMDPIWSAVDNASNEYAWKTQLANTV